MDTKRVVARFEAERQALALMDHPHIAKILDAGATDTGRPFFVMELVRGIPITEYCDTANLSTRERLELFVPVCQAIQHAHQKGVIHRDIKPSNILVTLNDGVPHPMVIDFGVAKAINQRLTERTLFTNFAQLIGTPVYMSPEQAEMSKLDVDTRTDVYSLGVLLYELLTGTTPFSERRLRGLGYAEMQRVIAEEEPPRPSTRLSTLTEVEKRELVRRHRTDPRNLGALFRRELDWVVMKALEKNRNRRYETVNALAMDVKRYLEGRALEAAPPTWRYQLGKLARKHRTTFAAAAVMAVALTGAAIFSTWQAIRAMRSESHALQSETEARSALATAEVQRKVAQDEARKARLNAYAADVSLAQRGIQEADIGMAKDHLRKHVPDPGEEDYRGWEWWYLDRLTKTQERFVLGQHPDEATEVAWSPEGGYIVSGGYSGTLKFWSSRDRRLLGTVQQPGRIHSMVFWSEDVLLTGEDDGFLRIWDVGRQRMLREIEVGGVLRALAIPKAGDCLVGVKLSGGVRFDGELQREGSVVVWELKRGMVDNTAVPELEVRFETAGVPRQGRFTWVRGMAISPDGRHVAKGFFDGRIRLLDLRTGRQLREWRAHTEPVGNLCFSPDGRRLVSSSVYSEVDAKIWDVKVGELVTLLKGHKGWLSGFAFTSDGRTLISSSADQTLRFWSTDTWEQRGSLRGHVDEVRAVAMSPDEQSLVTAGRDGSLLVWDCQPAPVPPTHIQIPNTKVPFRFSPVRQELAVVVFSDENRRVQLWTGTDLTDVRDIPELGNEARDLAYFPDGETLLVLEPGKLKSWDFKTKRLRAEVPLIEPPLLQFVGFTADGSQLLLIDARHTVQVWDISRWEQIGTWSARPNRDNGLLPSDGRMVNFCPRHGLLSLGGFKGFASLWDVGQRRWLGDLVDGFGHEVHAAFHPNGGLVGTVGTRVFSWDAKELGKTLAFAFPRFGLHSVTFSPDGRRLVAGGDARQPAFLWDTETGMELVRLPGDARMVFRVAFSHDGRFLAASSSAGVNVYDGRKSNGE